MAASSSAELVLLLTESQSPHHGGNCHLVRSSRCSGEAAEVVDGGDAEAAEAGVAVASDPMEVDGGIKVGDADAGGTMGGEGGGAQQPSPATVFRIGTSPPGSFPPFRFERYKAVLHGLSRFRSLRYRLAFQIQPPTSSSALKQESTLPTHPYSSQQAPPAPDGDMNDASSRPAPLA